MDPMAGCKLLARLLSLLDMNTGQNRDRISRHRAMSMPVGRELRCARRGISQLQAIVGVVVVVLLVVAVVALVTMDTTGRKGSGRGGRFAYELSPLMRTDPALIRYDEVLAFETGLESPRAIAVNMKGDVLVAGDTAVCVYAPDGALRRKMTLDESPRCLTVAADDTLYVGMMDHVEVIHHTYVER